MKAFIFNLFVFLLLFILPVNAQEQQVVPYTLADRDRIIRIEARTEALETKMDVKTVGNMQKNTLTWQKY